MSILLAPPAAAPLGPPEPELSGNHAEAARQFESWMVSFLSKEMRKTVPDGPWSSGAMSTFADLFDQEIGERVAAGGGFGLQDAILRAMGDVLQRHAPGGQLPTLPRLPSKGDPDHAHPAPVAPAGGLRISSLFGTRADPFTGESRRHHGVDYAAAEGTPIRAAADGVVRFAGRRGGYGNMVIVEHADGTETRYAHCRDLTVKAGETVNAGAGIATVGSTGRSTGPHLHFEVRKDGSPIDPLTWGGASPLGEKDR